MFYNFRCSNPAPSNWIESTTELAKTTGREPLILETLSNPYPSTPVALLSETSTTKLPTTAQRCCSTELPKPQDLNMIFKGMESIPEGYPEVITLNVAYNRIDHLPNFIFYDNNYTNVRKIILQENKISNISVNAFKDIRYLNEIDFSNNLINQIDPYTFKWNNDLKKIILINNQISFGRRQTFILSYSLEHLVLSSNKIDQIYELNFLGVPNLRSLFLNDNDIIKIAPNSFRMLSKLRYLSLANTGVYRVSVSMFSQIPRTLNLEGTPLAERFDPPLTKVTGESVVRLLDLSNAMKNSNNFITP